MEWRKLAKCLSATSLSLLAAGYVSNCAGEKPEAVAEPQLVIEEIQETPQTEPEVAVVEEQPVEIKEAEKIVEIAEEPVLEPLPVSPIQAQAAVQEPVPVVTTIIERPEPAPLPQKPEPVQPIAQPVVFKDPDPQPPAPPAVAVVEPEPEPEPVLIEKSEEEQEYERSVKQLEGVTVTQEEFNADKAAVLELIDELDEVMKKENYSAWLKYLDEESIKYWSQRSNLQTAQKRLPVKGLRLTSLKDYFRYIFIPSRVGRKVDEIRYETDTNVKVVQIRKDDEGHYEGDTVYYNLRKINGKWKVHLPEIS